MTLCVAMPGHGSLPAWVSPRKTEVQLVHPSRRRAEAERLWPQPGIQRMDELKTGTRRVGVAVRRCRLVGRQGRLWLVVLQDWSKPCRWLRRLSPSSQKVLMSSKLAKLLDLKTNLPVLVRQAERRRRTWKSWKRPSRARQWCRYHPPVRVQSRRHRCRKRKWDRWPSS